MDKIGLKSKDDYPALEIRSKENDCEIKIGNMSLKNILSYRIDSAALPGMAKLTLEIIVRYP